MNWFTESYVSNKTPEAKKKHIDTWGGCEHVTADPSLLAVIAYENDGFGREGYCFCQACHEKAEQEKGEEEVTCYDCKKEVKQKETYEYKWYDFYAPQGDEPLTICNECRKKEKHLARLRQDQADADYDDECS